MMEETLLAASRERQRQVQDVTGHSECSLKHNKNIYRFCFTDDTESNNNVKVLKPMWSPCVEIWKMWYRNGCQVDFSITYREASHRRKILCSVPVLLLWLRYTLDDWGTEVWLPVAEVFLFSTVSKPFLGPTQPIKWTLGIVSPWPNCSGHKSPLPNVEVNNAWSCISTPSYVLMIGEYFTLKMCLWYGTLWSYSSTVTDVHIFFNRWIRQCHPINCNPFCQKGKTLSHSRHLNWIVLQLAAEIWHLTT
jgi:hypothetical protein